MRTLSVAVPPAPVQVMVYVVPAVRLPVDWLPETPAQFPGDTVHDVVFIDVHDRVAEVLWAIVIGPSELFALMLAVGVVQRPVAPVVTVLE